jgi:hypothetical protein
MDGAVTAGAHLSGLSLGLSTGDDICRLCIGSGGLGKGKCWTRFHPQGAADREEKLQSRVSNGP